MPNPPISLPFTGGTTISTVEMHTTGEPTRIIYSGYPDLTGPLLTQRHQALTTHDHLRRRLNHEPRGHFDMYGAILRPETELTTTTPPTAHIGVLFTTNSGYSTMCGHATLALGRFLIDLPEDDNSIFPLRRTLPHDPNTNTTTLNLHAPCGLVRVTVPTLPGGKVSDPSRPVSFLSVPSFASGTNIRVPIGPKHQWLELYDRDYVEVDFAYGGAFYAFVTAKDLGFDCALDEVDLERMAVVTRNLKAAVVENEGLRRCYAHPEEEDLSFLYGVVVVDRGLGVPMEGTESAETGLCYFADRQVDRSPTGSALAARTALGVAKGEDLGRGRTYHSLVSLRGKDGKGGFVGRVEERVEVGQGLEGVVVRVEGFAYYTGFAEYVVEEEDPLGDDGFIFSQLTKNKSS